MQRGERRIRVEPGASRGRHRCVTGQTCVWRPHRPIHRASMRLRIGRGVVCGRAVLMMFMGALACREHRPEAAMHQTRERITQPDHKHEEECGDPVIGAKTRTPALLPAQPAPYVTHDRRGAHNVVVLERCAPVKYSLSRKGRLNAETQRRRGETMSFCPASGGVQPRTPRCVR